MKKILTLALVAAAAFAAEGYKIITKYKIGGTGGWDYVAVDSAAGRVYASHGTEVDVVDVNSGKVVGKIEQLHGVHGIAIAADLGKGFISNGQSNSVTVFDLKSLQKTGEPAVSPGQNPDGICYEPKTQRVFTFNGRTNDATAIDAKSNEIVGAVKLNGKPEFCAVDGSGKIYNNLEDTSEVIEIDAAKLTVLRRTSLAPAEEPSGLAIDAKNRKLFSVCGNKMMAVIDIPSFKVIATPAIGSGPDAAGFDPGTGLAFSSNGVSGNLTIVKEVGGKYDAVDTVATERGARTMTVDTKLHRVYLLAAEYGPAPEAKEGKKARPPVLPDSFHILVVGK